MGQFESFIGVDLWTALFVLLNTLAIFFVARKFLFKPVHKLISDRQAEIDEMYAEADRQKQSAESMAKELGEKLQDAQNESDRIVKDALVRAEGKEREIVAAARTEAQAVLDKAAKDAEKEKLRALNEAKDEIAAISINIAEKVLQRQLDDSDQSKLVDEFISRLGEDK
ncbi:MAG: F0F1 ATP synthase subunit B [Clostridia bacterium]|nr:F0F1 ATP synthase subunit B [Clostridia bacterium]